MNISLQGVLKKKQGFTLIELMIVVVIISILFAIVVPRIVGHGDKGRKKILGTKSVAESTLAGGAERTGQEGPPPLIPVTESAEVSLKLSSSNHIQGVNVFTRFDAAFDGNFVFRNLENENERAKLLFPFPRGTTQAKDVSLKFLDPSGAYREPGGVVYNLKGIKWVGPLPKGQTVSAKVTYGAQGYDKFIYEGPGAGRAGRFRIDMELDGVTAKFIPEEALQPTAFREGRLVWDFENLVTERRVIVELPGAMSPLGRIILFCKLTGLAVLLFGAGFLYLSELKQPGVLDNFRWGHFLLLALTYSLFFVIFAVFTLGGEISILTSMLLSAALSFPLLVLHVSRIIDRSFALARVLPLVVFTLVLVITGVYGGDSRKYIYILFTVFTVGFFTITYKPWSEKKKAFQKEKEEKKEEESQRKIQERKENEREKTRNNQRHSLKVDSLKALGEAGKSLKEAENLGARGMLLAESVGEKDPGQRDMLKKAIEKLSESRSRYHDINSKVRAVSGISDDSEYERVCKTESDNANNLNLYTRVLMEQLLEGVGGLERLKEMSRAKTDQEKGILHCIACGVSSPLSTYCPNCGVLRPVELTCGKCGEIYRLPAHIIDKNREIKELHCLACGERHEYESESVNA